MRKVVMSRVMGAVILGLSMTVLAGKPLLATAPLQQIAGSSSGVVVDPVVRTKEAGKGAKSTALASNATTAPKKEALSAKDKDTDKQGKTTLSRCWKRLMDNLREVRHAHRKKQ